MLEVSKAIIYQDSWYLLQLRHHTPDITYAGYWWFFGGTIEKREPPWPAALQRKLSEELERQPELGTYLSGWVNPELPCRIDFLMVPFSDERSALVLHEGQDLSCFNLDGVAHYPRVAPHVLQHLQCDHNHLPDSQISQTADVSLY